MVVDVVSIIEDIMNTTGCSIEEFAEDFNKFNKAIDSFIDIGFTDDAATELVASLWEAPYIKLCK